jgi:hypothetical protein
MKIAEFFRSEQVNSWPAFAEAMGGTCTAAGFGNQQVIEVPHNGHVIRIEGHVTMIMTGKVMIPVLSTRFSTTLPSVPAHRFSVARANFATSVAEWFGALDIHVDDATFDHAFVLKGDTPDVVRQLFADAALRQQYLTHFEGQLHRHDDAGTFHDPTPGADPLALDVSGHIEDPARLRALYDLFVATLDRVEMHHH